MKPKHRRRLDVLGNLGLVARAVTYSMIAILSIQAVTGRGHPHLDRSGALAVIAAQPFGRTILLGLACGFIGFALWRGAVAIRPPEPASMLVRIGWMISAVFHAVMAGLALVYLAGTHGEHQWDAADLTARAMNLPLGRWIIGAVGMGLIGDAGWAGWRAVSLRFRKYLDHHRMSERAQGVATVTGIAGLAFRAVVHVVMGAFLMKAAWLDEPKDAVGMDETLWFLRRIPWGGFVMLLLAAGLLARAGFELVQARYRKRA